MTQPVPSGGPPGGAGRLLVAGASSGIGRAVAAVAARAGWQVVAAARRLGPLEVLAAAHPDRIEAVPADIRSAPACQELIERAVIHLGGLDAVVVSAGYSPLGELAATEPATWYEVLETNLLGPAWLARAASGPLSSSAGRLVLLGSHSVGDPWPGLVPYAVSKAGLAELARGLRAEVDGFDVSLVVVGPTASQFADGWEPEAAAAMFSRWEGAGRLGAAVQSPEAVARVVLEVLEAPVPPELRWAMPAADPRAG